MTARPGVVSEAAFQRTVLEYARLKGWRVAHFRAARRDSGGWSTPVQGDGAGFPDLVLVRAGVAVFAELKSARGRLTDTQQVWLDALRIVAACSDSAVHVHVWRPADWPDIEEVLGA